MKGGKGWGQEISMESEDEREMMRMRQPSMRSAHMEGSSNRDPRLQQFIENPFAEALREEWKPPSPPAMPLMTQPKAPRKGKKNDEMAPEKASKRGKEKVLKQRMVWVMSSGGESEDDKKTLKLPTTEEKPPKGTKKCMQWVEVDEDQRVKLSHFI